MIRRLLPGVILGLLLAGCAPQVIQEEPEYRRLAAPRLSPEKYSFRAQDISTVHPAPLRIPEQNPVVVWSEEAKEELQSIRPALFLKYASRPGGLSGCHAAETALLQNRFAEVMKLYPVNPTGRRMEESMRAGSVPEMKALLLSKKEEGFIQVEHVALWIRYQRLARQVLAQERLLNEIGKLFGSPKSDRALCVYPAYALQKLEYMGLRLELAKEIEKIRTLYKRQKEW